MYITDHQGVSRNCRGNDLSASCCDCNGQHAGWMRFFFALTSGSAIVFGVSKGESGRSWKTTSEPSNQLEMTMLKLISINGDSLLMALVWMVGVKYCPCGSYCSHGRYFWVYDHWSFWREQTPRVRSAMHYAGKFMSIKFWSFFRPLFLLTCDDLSLGKSEQEDEVSIVLHFVLLVYAISEDEHTITFIHIFRPTGALLASWAINLCSNMFWGLNHRLRFSAHWCLHFFSTRWARLASFYRSKPR